MNRAWAIKLGSGGRCVPFCEHHKIVGVGWRSVDERYLRDDDKAALFNHIQNVHQGVPTRTVGNWTGALTRFCKEAENGDIVIYYDPPRKRVQICEIASDVKRRNFDLGAHDTVGEEVDIWYYRQVKYLCDPISIVEFFAPLKGKLLGPRGTIWELHNAYESLRELASGTLAHDLLASEPDLRKAHDSLRKLIVKRMQVLDDRGWELLVAEYFRAQGAHVDREVGGSRAIIDIEASFSHGELGDQLWRVQVKRYQDQPVRPGDLEYLLRHAGDAELCFVSAFGFTEHARNFADENDIRLLEAADFVPFLLGSKLSPELVTKLRIPRQKSARA